MTPKGITDETGHYPSILAFERTEVAAEVAAVVHMD